MSEAHGSHILHDRCSDDLRKVRMVAVSVVGSRYSTTR